MFSPTTRKSCAGAPGASSCRRTSGPGSSGSWRISCAPACCRSRRSRTGAQSISPPSMRDHGRSPASRYRRLSEDVFADAKLMEPFAFVTARVSRPTRRACARSPMSATLPRGRRARRRSGSPRTDASLPGCGGRSTDAPPPIVTRSSTSSSKRRKRTGLRSSGRFAPLRSAEFFSTAFPAAHGRPAAACRRQRKWWRLRQSFRATRWS
jgi:hypothetical protein